MTTYVVKYKTRSGREGDTCYKNKDSALRDAKIIRKDPFFKKKSIVVVTKKTGKVISPAFRPKKRSYFGVRWF